MDAFSFQRSFDISGKSTTFNANIFQRLFASLARSLAHDHLPCLLLYDECDAHSLTRFPILLFFAFAPDVDKQLAKAAFFVFFLPCFALSSRVPAEDLSKLIFCRRLRRPF